MTQENLERVEKPAERVETLEVKTPSGEEKPTLGRTFTEEEFGKAQSSWDRQIALAKAEAKKATSEVEQFKAESKHSEAYIQSLKEEMARLANAADDPDVKKSYTDRMASLEREMKLAQREAEVERKLYEAEMTAWSARMAQRANELTKETGIDVKELEDCKTEEEMEVKALRFQLGKPTQEQKPKKFASQGSGGGGRSLDDMSARELIKLDIQQRKK